MHMFWTWAYIAFAASGCLSLSDINPRTALQHPFSPAVDRTIGCCPETRVSGLPDSVIIWLYSQRKGGEVHYDDNIIGIIMKTNVFAKAAKFDNAQ